MNPPTQINMILYRIGEAGNFLTRLFSLSPKTQFLWKQGTCGCSPNGDSLEEKIRWYWYYPEKIKNWMVDAHQLPVGWEKITHHIPYWEKNSIIVSCIHYHNFLMNTTDGKYFNPPGLKMDERYFSIKVSKENYNILKKNIGYTTKMPQDRTDKIKDIEKITTVHTIDLDKILSSDEEFLEEYKRVCDLMGLEPIDDEVSVSFLKNWKSFRFV